LCFLTARYTWQLCKLKIKLKQNNFEKNAKLKYFIGFEHFSSPKYATMKIMPLKYKYMIMQYIHGKLNPTLRWLEWDSVRTQRTGADGLPTVELSSQFGRPQVQIQLGRQLYLDNTECWAGILMHESWIYCITCFADDGSQIESCIWHYQGHALGL
jgi:hypothetical protein